MGVLFDYFSAASDEAAASVINLPGGPCVSAAAPSRAGWFKPRRATPPAGAWFDTVSAKGIDPLVQMGTLEALLTGRDYDQIVAGPRAGQTLGSRPLEWCMGCLVSSDRFVLAGRVGVT